MTADTLSLQFLKTLSFSAASGLANVADRFCTVSDDQVQLEIFSLSPLGTPEFFRLFEGELPTEKKARKSAKPDLETLLLLPPKAFEQTLLAIPSGSTLVRRKGVAVRFEGATPKPALQPIDFSELYTFLQTLLPELNIEGAAFRKDEVLLFQRGNGAESTNAIVTLDAKAFLEDVIGNGKVRSRSFIKTTLMKLPILNGVQTSFTDAASDPQDLHRVWFLAAAEQSASTYEDGPFAGALLGCLNDENQIVRTWALDISEKPEGLWIDTYANFFIVTDSDNTEIPSKTLKGSLPLSWD